MWRFVLPELSRRFRVVLFDYVGSGNSDQSQFSSEKYASLDGYASDVIDICLALDLTDATFVGHSVSSMIGLIASIKAPEHFSKIVMVCPSPCFLNISPEYFGGFERADLEELLNLMDKNYIGWADYFAPLVMGSGSTPEMTKELSESFCSTDPRVAKSFARATFFSDKRNLLSEGVHPTLILQSSHDALASVSVGEFVKSRLPDAEMIVIQAEGHCLHMTHPDEVYQKIIDFAGG
jgi:sigma-B regulation protein RsbQ